MEKTKANFRALREMCGLSQQDVADAADVNRRSVKRWEESGNDWEPPEDVWEWILACAEVQAETVDAAVSAAMAHPGGAVQVTYYRTQEQFDAMGRDDGPYGMANANSRLAAHRLMALGREVEFSYPDDAGNVYHGASGSRGQSGMP